MFDDRIGNLQKMLARMGPEGRQRYAADHADDPIAVSMALFVNNIAKELKEGKRGEPEMQAPVVQQAIQAMNQPRMPQGMPPQGMPPQGQPQAPQQAPQGPPQGQPQMAADGGYMDSRLPEEMGIGALPERSLSNMADGGIVGYAKGGDSGPGTTADYRRYALTQAAKMGLDPQFVDSIFSHESRTKAYPTGYDPNAKSGSGSTGIGQLISATGKAYGVAPEERTNPIKNIDASLRFMRDLQKKYNNDPRLMAVAYNQGETVLNNHLKKNNGVLVPDNLRKEIAKSLTEKGNLTPEQVAQRAVEPVNYLKRTVDKPKDTANPFGGAAAPAPAAPAPAAPAPAAPAPAAPAPAPAAAPATKSATTADLQALRQSKENFGAKLDTAGQVARSLIQNPLAQVASGFAGLAGSVLPGPEGQGADYVKRTQDYLGYNPEYKKDSKKILGVLGYPLEALRKYAADPAGEYLAEQGLPAIGATVKGAIEAAPAALGFLGRGAKASAAPAATTKAAPGAAAPTPGAGTVIPPVKQTGLTQAQKNAVSTAVPVPAAGAGTTGRSGLTQGQINAAAGAPPLMGPPKPTPAQLAAQQKQAAGLQAIANQKQAAAASFVGPPKPTPAQVAAQRGAGLGALAATTPKPAAALTGPPKPTPAQVAAQQAAAASFVGPLRPTPAQVAAQQAAAGRQATTPKPAAGAGAGAGEGVAATKPGLLALLPAAVAAGAGTGSGASSTPEADRTSGDDTRGFPEIPPLKLTPEVKQEAVALAKAEIPKEERSGFGYEDLLSFGLNLLAGQSPNALTNVGTAGIAALTAKQARTAAEKKTAMEERKIASDEKQDAAYSKYLESETGRKALEDKPQMQYQKTVDKAVADAVASMAYQLAKTPAEKAQLEADARARAKASFLAVYPELADTMGSGGFKVLGSRPSP